MTWFMRAYGRRRISWRKYSEEDGHGPFVTGQKKESFQFRIRIIGRQWLFRTMEKLSQQANQSKQYEL